MHEAPLTGGFGGEVAAVVAREAFAWLDAPVERLGALDTPVPAAQALEEIFSPKARLLPALRALLASSPAVMRGRFLRRHRFARATLVAETRVPNHPRAEEADRGAGNRNPRHPLVAQADAERERDDGIKKLLIDATVAPIRPAAVAVMHVHRRSPSPAPSAINDAAARMTTAHSIPTARRTAA